MGGLRVSATQLEIKDSFAGTGWGVGAERPCRKLAQKIPCKENPGEEEGGGVRLEAVALAGAGENS